jgi:hypothetical protein
MVSIRFGNSVCRLEAVSIRCDAGSILWSAYIPISVLRVTNIMVT